MIQYLVIIQPNLQGSFASHMALLIASRRDSTLGRKTCSNNLFHASRRDATSLLRLRSHPYGMRICVCGLVFYRTSHPYGMQSTIPYTPHALSFSRRLGASAFAFSFREIRTNFSFSSISPSPSIFAMSQAASSASTTPGELSSFSR